MALQFPTGTITFLFTDIEGSSTLWEKHPSSFQLVLNEHDSLLREIMTRHDGLEVRDAGDGFFLAFERASDAILFAIEAQAAIASHCWKLPDDSQEIDLRVRIGMHTGEAYLAENPGQRPNYFGTAVNRAARVGVAGHGGQIVISEPTRIVAQPGLPAEVTFANLGIHRLKGVGEEHLWQVCHPGLGRQFPPLLTLNAERHNLPAPQSPFIGREAELESWSELLQRPTTRLLTLLGFGGMGKTRSALQLAEMCVHDFKDGVWWIELDEVNNRESMLSAIANQLQFTLQSQLPIKDQLFNFLRERQCLLVLDNLEQITDAGIVVKQLLDAAPYIKCLVTSRRALELRSEQLVNVLPLPQADAEALFLTYAQARRDDFSITPDNAADIRVLCAYLQGVPLALELAASRIRVLEPRDIVERLREHFDVLQSRAPDLAPRQRAVRAAIDWSYELLTEEDQSLFAQLSVFTGGFTLRDAEAICAAPDVTEGVDCLLMNSLLYTEESSGRGQKRFTMLEMLRSYAAEKLSEAPDGGAKIRLQHARYFLQFARSCMAKLRTGEEVKALGELELNLGNVNSAMENSTALGQHQTAAQLALVLGQYLQRRGVFREALRRIEAGLKVAQTNPADEKLYGELLCERASLHLVQFEWEQAKTVADEALSLFAHLNEPAKKIDAHILLALADFRNDDKQSDPDGARQHLTLALEECESVGDELHRSVVMHNLGLVEAGAGNQERAIQLFQTALELRQAQGDQRGIAETSNNLGMLAQDQSNWPEAQRYYEESLRYAQALGDAFGVARALSNLGEVAESTGVLQGAYRLFAAAESLFGEVGSPYQKYSFGLLQNVASQLNLPVRPAELQEKLKARPLSDVIEWAMNAE